MIAAWNLLFGCVLAGVFAADERQYRTGKEGHQQLKETLTVREEQGGVAGTSVKEWTVRPSGKWVFAQYLNRGEKEAAGSRSQKTGMLTQKQLAELGDRLSRHDLLGLPENLGQRAKVNPHQYTLQFGKKQTVIAGVPPRTEGKAEANIIGAAPKDAKEEAARWKRAAQLVQTVIELTTGD